MSRVKRRNIATVKLGYSPRLLCLIPVCCTVPDIRNLKLHLVTASFCFYFSFSLTFFILYCFFFFAFHFIFVFLLFLCFLESFLISFDYCVSLFSSFTFYLSASFLLHIKCSPFIHSHVNKFYMEFYEA